MTLNSISDFYHKFEVENVPTKAHPPTGDGRPIHAYGGGGLGVKTSSPF